MHLNTAAVTEKKVGKWKWKEAALLGDKHDCFLIWFIIF